jgi:hypothetical protein
VKIPRPLAGGAGAVVPVSSDGATTRSIAAHRAVDHFHDPLPHQPLFRPSGEQRRAFLEAGGDFRRRLDLAARRGARPGSIDFALVNALALDPLEWPSFASLLGAK